MMRTVMRAGTICASLALVGAAGAAAEPAESAPTFAKDVAPILFENCVECHRPNHIAPMSLMSYEDTRPWARAIKKRVAAREMPPWGAAAGIQEYANDASLSQEEINTIVAWVDGGAPKGNDADLPPPPEFTEGWIIGEPDLIFTMLEPFHVPADGTIPYLYYAVPTSLTEDIWIRGSEIKPTDRRVVHHVITDLLEGDGRPPDPKPKLQPDRSRKELGGLGSVVPNRFGGLYDEGVARRVPAGADIQMQMHYTTIGEPTTDRTSIGVVLAKEPPAKLRKSGGGMVPGRNFVIPPFDPNYEVKGSLKIGRDTYLSSMMPHMHVRGKDAKYSIIFPDGREQVVLWVPRYDFNWQLSYKLKEPIFMPKGSTLEVVAHFDNSPANKFNPDPTAEVRYGDQTWEEMMNGFYGTIEIESAESSER